MREPEFLPRWYGELLRRRRFLMAQAICTAAICASLAGWSILGMRHIQQAQDSLGHTNAQLARTGVDLQRLADLSAIKEQLQTQNQIVSGLGADVPVSRLLTALEHFMPPRMALQNLKMQTLETPQPLTDQEKARGITPTVHRKLSVTLTGVAPSRDDLATFLDDLVAVPYFSEVELVKADDASVNYHSMRRFDVSFAMSLDADAPARSGGPVASSTEGEH